MPCARSPLLVTGPMASGLKRLSLQMSLVKNPTGNPFELAADSIIRHAELFVAASSANAGQQRRPQKNTQSKRRARADFGLVPPRADIGQRCRISDRGG